MNGLSQILRWEWRATESVIKGPIIVLTRLTPLTPTLSPQLGERAG
jgi:hypothetical protein